ncbi:acyl carrier protein [Burkholderia sp. Ch1-1]|uniref:Acyl carrier protein n=1 Tax=Paraburkholderia dioscoreae TaxID=2604047 RepID=A0A5Q4ZAD3_9BURK|nr:MULTISPECIES: acyl carrier protein [Paraburkholderia]EIF31055.1 acyl carrier protein [Burkholderia sp. Ch1-1]MDR8401504.1 acyl carrier protein [Paraburkholderia sp. USG1]VVD28757.1 Acyl carrier protein [Paraburkholderia dioscoreae]
MKTHVRRILREAACLDVPVDTLDDHDDLYAAGLSSLGTVRVMMAIEDEFAIEIPGAQITHELFESIDSLASVLAHIVPEESSATRT